MTALTVQRVYIFSVGLPKSTVSDHKNVEAIKRSFLMGLVVSRFTVRPRDGNTRCYGIHDKTSGPAMRSIHTARED